MYVLGWFKSWNFFCKYLFQGCSLWILNNLGIRIQIKSPLRVPKVFVSFAIFFSFCKSDWMVETFIQSVLFTVDKYFTLIANCVTHCLKFTKSNINSYCNDKGLLDPLATFSLFSVLCHLRHLKTGFSLCNPASS